MSGPRNASQEDWEALVIGGGPAGALAATLLARRGVHTLIVDRKPFPRAKVCGGFLNGRALGLLSCVGLEGLCDRLAAPWVRHLQVQIPGSSAVLALPQGRSLTRRTLDAALVAEAVAAGAEFREGCSARVLAADPQQPASALRQVVVESATGPALAVSAKVVLVADGLGHPSLADLPEFAQRIVPHARIGLGTTLRGGRAWLSPETLLMAVGRDGYVGLVRAEDDQWNLAASLHRDRVRLDGAAGAVRCVLAESGIAPPLDWETATWMGTPPLTRRTRRVGSHRLLLVGDALGYIEPFTGEGMAWALSAAVGVIPYALDAILGRSADLTREWDSRYHQLVRRGQRVCRAVSWLVQHPWLTSGAVCLMRRHPAVFRPLLQNLNSVPPRVEALL